MTLTFRNWIRSLALFLVLGTAAPAAAGWNLRGDSTPAPRRETLWGLPRDDPAIAVGALVLLVLIVVVVAWVAARLGDKA